MSGQFTRHSYPHRLFGRAPDCKGDRLDLEPFEALSTESIDHRVRKQILQDSSGCAMTRVQHLKTSAALRSPVLLPPLHKTVGSPSSSYLTNNSRNSNDGRKQQPEELPQPTPQGYEKCAHNNDGNKKDKDGDDDYDDPFDFLNTSEAITKIQQACEEMRFHKFPSFSRTSEAERPTTREESSAATTITPAQDYWQNLWCSGCTKKCLSSLSLLGIINNSDLSLYHNSNSSSGGVSPGTTSLLNHSATITAGATGTKDNNKRHHPRSWSQIAGTPTRATKGSDHVVTAVVDPHPPASASLSVSSLESAVKLTVIGQSGEKINNNNNQQLPVSHQRPYTMNNNTTRLLSESAAFHSNAIVLQQQATTSADPTSLRQQQPSPEQKFVLKVSSIPWTASIKDIESLFAGIVKLPNQGKAFSQQCVHIMIDKSTGKTHKEAYVELDSKQDASIAIRRIKNPKVKGRKVYLTKSTQETLFRAVFPEWDGMFMNDKPTFVDTEEDDRSSGGGGGGCSSSMTATNTTTARVVAAVPPLLVKPEEYEALLGICRNYKACFSRKCPERPFENFISIMTKFPWDTPDIITTMQRDHLYEYYKLATGALRFHLNRLAQKDQISSTLMDRMVHTALKCQGLTANQKKGILIASEIPCPAGLEKYLVPPQIPLPPVDAVAGVFDSVSSESYYSSSLSPYQE